MVKQKRKYDKCEVKDKKERQRIYERRWLQSPKGKIYTKRQNYKNRNYMRNYRIKYEQGEAYKNSQLKYRVKTYGLNLEQLNHMMISQNNQCAICKNLFSKDKHWEKCVIDHSHNTGKVRELLCHRCNILIGIAKENINRLYGAINYLKKWNNYDETGMS